MIGTPGQIDWAEQIKPRVAADFDRVANAFRAVAVTQASQERDETLAIIGILEEKRAEVLANRSAGYFLKQWRDLNDQVRLLLAADPRYQAIVEQRAQRKNPHQPDGTQR